ncbi:MAG: hypothetical protein ABI026_04200 [Gemmatimonadaceae bacterium]
MPPLYNVIARSFIAAAVVGACAACASASYDTPNTLGVMPLQPPTPIWLGAIAAAGGSSAVDGAAAVTPSQMPGWTHIMLSLDNSTAGAVYTWSLRSGNCGGQGNIIGPSDRYARFNIHADGTGAVETVIPTTLSQSESYAVIATPVSPSTGSAACANLTRTTM